MKILLIHNSKSLGGGTLSLIDLASGIINLGHSLDILLQPGDSDAKSLIKSRGYNVIENSFPLITFNYYNGGPGLAKIILKKIKYCFSERKSKEYWNYSFPFDKYDLIILNSSVLSPMIDIIKKKNDNIITFIRETVKSKNLNLINNYISQRLSKSMTTVFLSEFDKNGWKVKSKNSMVIPDTLNDEMFLINNKQTNILENYKISTKDFIILYTGGFNELKGLHILLKSFKKIDNKNVLLIILGKDGQDIINASVLTKILNFKYYMYVKKQYKTIGKSKNKIRIIGNVSNPSEWYKISDLVVFPATKPHQSRPLYEAGYFSKPIIIPRFKNYEEYLIDGYNGLYYDPNNYNSLYEKIMFFIKDKEYIVKMGENNKLSTLEKRNYETFLKVFDKIINIR